MHFILTGAELGILVKAAALRPGPGYKGPRTRGSTQTDACSSGTQSSVSMSYHLSSGSLSARSLGGYLRYPGCPCDAFSPGNVVYPPGTGQRGPVLCGGHQETCCEPASCRAPCYGPRTGSFCGPCPSNAPGPAGWGSSGPGPFGYGSSRVQAVGCGPSFGRPPSFSSRSYQSPCFQPACSSRYFGPTY